MLEQGIWTDILKTTVYSYLQKRRGNSGTELQTHICHLKYRKTPTENSKE